VGLIDCATMASWTIITVNGSSVERTGSRVATLSLRFTIKDANLKFTDITKQAGLTRKGWGMGVPSQTTTTMGCRTSTLQAYGGNVLGRYTT